MKIFPIWSWLHGANASRTVTRSRRSVSRRVLCVEGLERRMLLNADAAGPVVDRPADAGSVVVETVVEPQSTNESADKTAYDPSGEKSPGSIRKPIHLTQVKDEAGGKNRSREERGEGKTGDKNRTGNAQRILRELREGRGKDRGEAGVSHRAEAVRAVVAIFTELGRSLGLDASPGEATRGFARILGGDLSRGTVMVFGPFLSAGDPLDDSGSGDSGDSGDSSGDDSSGSGDSGGSSGDEGSGSGGSSGEGESNSGSEPYILTFDASSGQYNSWILEGTVTYEDPSLVTVVFDGAVTGSTSVEANGSFSYSITVPEGTNGIVTAQAFNSAGVGSNVVYDWIA